VLADYRRALSDSDTITIRDGEINQRIRHGWLLYIIAARCSGGALSRDDHLSSVLTPPTRASEKFKKNKTQYSYNFLVRSLYISLEMLSLRSPINRLLNARRRAQISSTSRKRKAFKGRV